ncbi:DUF1990 domain-containing protein [Rubinisphaera italica]|uniref:DUF1990 domain-containing protein n=1 Tax=Rubinisphaera italica TaxID=2527969 RepID=A0A5C5XJY5_9PLAN|nr:DUF1990 domain-containing protein [Rubinisphaera italica]TWT62711.1 hypothetical protein Pan54_34560 [Rubinisphaera italica]
MAIMSFQKPSAEFLSRFLNGQKELEFTYPEFGATAGELPQGYLVDRTRIELGNGLTVFEKAKQALEQWEQFQLGWVETWPREVPIQTGEEVAIMAKSFGCWWLNSCRIVYCIDDQDAITKFGFAYGTLPGHLECGEERFLIEWNRQTDIVAYEILAFSKPGHLLTRLGYPFARRNQKRFARESAARLQHVASSTKSSRVEFKNEKAD